MPASDHDGFERASGGDVGSESPEYMRRHGLVSGGREPSPDSARSSSRFKTRQSLWRTSGRTHVTVAGRNGSSRTIQLEFRYF